MARKQILHILKELGDREAATGLRGLQEFAPVQYLDDAARALGGGASRVLDVAVPQRQIDELGDLYRAAPDIDERLLPAYEAMRRGTMEQIDMLTAPRRRGGLGVDVRVTDADPYDVTTPEGLREMLDELADRRLAVLSTRATGGHPVLSDAENDAFRAVHDAFGHAATGRGFSRHGEEAAFRAHSAMYPREAMPALVSELRAQNAYLNRFGDFGPQKLFVAPERYMSTEPFPLTDQQRAAALMDAIARMRNSGRF